MCGVTCRWQPITLAEVGWTPCAPELHAHTLLVHQGHTQRNVLVHVPHHLQPMLAPSAPEQLQSGTELTPHALQKGKEEHINHKRGTQSNPHPTVTSQGGHGHGTPQPNTQPRGAH